MKLTVFATTDVHGAVYPYNYFDNEPKDNALLKFKTYIDKYKAMNDEEAVITADNGDLLQGDVWSDYDSDNTDKALVPRIINEMYDVIGAGNHEFNFGLPFLNEFYKQVTVPIVNSNVDFMDNPLKDIVKNTYIHVIKTADGPVKVGFLSVVPTQILKWDKFHLEDRVKVSPMTEAVRATTARLKNDGADIVILLSHTGMSNADDDLSQFGENQAILMAMMEGIDGIVFGHTHDVFPNGNLLIEDERIDIGKGTFNHIPMVQPGVSASHLGVLNFELAYDNGMWQVKKASSRLISAEDIVLKDDELEDYKEEHEKVLGYLNIPIGKTDYPLNTYFTRVIPSRGVQFVSEATVWFAKERADFKDSSLPVIGFNSAVKVGRDGPHDYTAIPPGEMTIADSIDIYKHANTLLIIKINGKVLKEWLEWAASSFNNYDGEEILQPNNSRYGFPGYNFDTFFDLDYTFDLTKPARYESSARQISDSERVIKMSYKGEPIKESDEFIVPANNYKVAYAPFLRDAEILYESAISVRDIVTEYIKSGETFDYRNPMTIIPHGTYRFTTAAEAKEYTAGLPVEHYKDLEDGFSIFKVEL
ncbi:Trifunctional nucleotide phosphoesterase protein YfkN precursor [Jeotgalicoccus saudimassiliensis]|uniref:Trifunctional nucleotide phosphoesterase protein YfkN n=1 Tax=Jeotgalicoccus saudimassiliensis TaxID=1461582 RepID=A0A078MC37_9STAP|nr:5'-nucleotidase C-terminal domain-containing protein [Jeotgalicoccus saudimassiliensis]CEA03845.1 Trifunctional nucleotide phosphoesterase protein YfkN precursor [Jeotgalicoccus saudimassiliensis]